MALADAALDEGGLDARIEVEQAQRVRDRRLARGRRGGRSPRGSARTPRSAAGTRAASSIGPRSARWRFSTSATSSCVPIGELADDGRDALEAGETGRPEAALARDELVAVEGLGDEDRAGGRRARGCSPRGPRARRRRTAGAAGGDWARSARAGSRVTPFGWARCGISDARPRPRPLCRSEWIVMNGLRSRRVRWRGSGVATARLPGLAVATVSVAGSSRRARCRGSRPSRRSSSAANAS